MDFLSPPESMILEEKKSIFFTHLDVLQAHGTFESNLRTFYIDCMVFKYFSKQTFEAHCSFINESFSQKIIYIPELKLSRNFLSLLSFKNGLYPKYNLLLITKQTKIEFHVRANFDNLFQH